MFEDTLLIIKADYMHKRKAVLLKLLQKGFQIQGHRKVLFSPEHAAEFYKELSEDKNFMLNVILLSKGNAEAFILTKENAVCDLLSTMICYFTTSIEMERNVHVSKCSSSVRHEISFIFPNYIYEPVPYFENMSFCKKTMMTPLVNELYDIMQNCMKKQSCRNWKEKLAEWLMATNKSVPLITNQCSLTAAMGFEDKAQQVTSLETRKDPCHSHRSSLKSSGSSPSSDGSSVMMSSSSCITCSAFEGVDIRDAPVEKVDSLTEMVEAKLQQTGPITLIEEEQAGEEQAEEEHVGEEVGEEEGVVANWHEVTDADEIFITPPVPEQTMPETLTTAESAETLVEPEAAETLVEPEPAKTVVVAESAKEVVEAEPAKEVVEAEPEPEKPAPIIPEEPVDLTTPPVHTEGEEIIGEASPDVVAPAETVEENTAPPE